MSDQGNEMRSLAPYRAMLSSLDGEKYYADWADERNHFRRLVTEFIGTFGLLFVLSFGSAILSHYATPELPKYAIALVISVSTSLWLLASIYAFGDISAHFNPAVTFAFALRRDMSWRRAIIYWVVQLAGGACASLLARLWFGTASGLGLQLPQHGYEWQSLAFEAVMTAGFVLVVLASSRGPKINGAFVPIAVAAYITVAGAIGALYNGVAINPARAFAPALATGHFGVLWVYFGGDLVGALAAVAVDSYLRGNADIHEAKAAEHPATEVQL